MEEETGDSERSRTMGKEEGNQDIISPTPQEVEEANKGLIRENPLIPLTT